MSDAYGEECVERCTARRSVRGNRTKNQGTRNVHYKPHRGQPKTADSAGYRERVNNMICEQGVIAGIVGISRETVNHIMMGELIFTKVCSR